MSGHFARGVVATILTRDVHARNAEPFDLLGFCRLPPTGHIEEIAIQVAGHPARQLRAIDFQRAGEPRNLIRRERHLLGIHPHRINRRADCQRLAVAVSDGPPMRGYESHSREPRSTLFCEETMIDELQIHCTRGKSERSTDEQPDQQVGPPAERGRGIARASCLHGAMISISLGGGIAMCSFALATRSTNACVDHALCSSCSCPHSI